MLKISGVFVTMTKNEHWILLFHMDTGNVCC